MIYELDDVRLVAEMLVDVQAFDEARGRLDRGGDELIPLEIIERRLAGESPLKIWRDDRALTQAALAKVSNVSHAMIAAIETGHKTGSSARGSQPQAEPRP